MFGYEEGSREALKKQDKKERRSFYVRSEGMRGRHGSGRRSYVGKNFGHFVSEQEHRTTKVSIPSFAHSQRVQLPEAWLFNGAAMRKLERNGMAAFRTYAPEVTMLGQMGPIA